MELWPTQTKQTMLTVTFTFTFPFSCVGSWSALHCHATVSTIDVNTVTYSAALFRDRPPI